MAKTKMTYHASNELVNHPQKSPEKVIRKTCSTSSSSSSTVTTPLSRSSAQEERPLPSSGVRKYVKSGMYSKKQLKMEPQIEIESAQFIAKIERQPCPQEQEVCEGDVSGFSEASADSQSSIYTSDADISSCDSDSAAKQKRTKKRIPFPKKSEKRDKRNRELWEVAQKIITVDKHMKVQRGVMNSTQMDAFLASQSYIKSVDEFNHYARVVKKGW